MLTGSTFEVVVVLALIAVVHTVVSTLIACKLTRDEQALAETSNTVLVGTFNRMPANDGGRVAGEQKTDISARRRAFRYRLPFAFFVNEVCESENAKRFVHPDGPFIYVRLCTAILS